MQPDFRRRAFTPVVLPLTLVGVILLFAWSLAQILLVVPAAISAVIALALALYVLVIASLVAARRRISSRILGVSLALGFLSIVAAGAVAAAAGPRPLEHEGEEVAGEAGPEGETTTEGEATTEGGGATEGADGGGEIPPDAQTFVAVDIDYSSAPETMPAGEVTVAIDNQGQIVHNVVFEELGTEPIVEANGGEVDVGTTTVEAGDYTYYCSIPGHRAAGMEGVLTVQ